MKLSTDHFGRNSNSHDGAFVGYMGPVFLNAKDFGAQASQLLAVGLNHLPVSEVAAIKWVGQPLKQWVGLSGFGFVHRKNAKGLRMTFDHFSQAEKSGPSFEMNGR